MDITPVAADFSKYPRHEASRRVAITPRQAPQPEARVAGEIVSVEADFSRYHPKGRKDKEAATPHMRMMTPPTGSTGPVPQRPSAQSSPHALRDHPTPPVDGMKEWWITRATSLSESSMNGWVLSCMLDEYSNESLIVRACEKPTYAERVTSAGLQEALHSEGGPRKRCKFLAQAGSEK